MNIMICGGAGYIGSHMAYYLAQRDHNVIVLDNLSTGHRAAVKWGELVHADLSDPGSLDKAFAGRKIDAVMHFAASSIVGESTRDPLSYYRNNVAGSLNLIHCMRAHSVDNIVFSSTAAIFGNPIESRISEEHPKSPINPYGASKLFVERILSDAAGAYGINSVSLRYFNAAGALSHQGIGESHICETHLIPNVLKSVLSPSRRLQVFGDDYPTPDGTCIRDYVHVEDLASAHALALDFMKVNPGASSFNLGNGQGFSVLEIIEAARSVTGSRIMFDVVDRRAGDPSILVATSEQARSILGWSPKWTDIGAIISSAWDWHRNPNF